VRVSSNSHRDIAKSSIHDSIPEITTRQIAHGNLIEINEGNQLATLSPRMANIYQDYVGNNYTSLGMLKISQDEDPLNRGSHQVN
jgi:hypothetical protein